MAELHTFAHMDLPEELPELPVKLLTFCGCGRIISAISATYGERTTVQHFDGTRHDWRPLSDEQQAAQDDYHQTLQDCNARAKAALETLRRAMGSVRG